MPNDCICPDPNKKCHLGRQKGNEKDPLCSECIDLWFHKHLEHRIGKMIKLEGAESKCIVMRSLLQFLGLSSKPNPDAQSFELALAGRYKFLRKKRCAHCRSFPEVTYEVRADNLGGKSFDSASLAQYKSDHPEEAELLARFLYGVHVHTAHLNWGANHSDTGPIWDINHAKDNKDVVQQIRRLLKERVYGNRPFPEDANRT